MAVTFNLFEFVKYPWKTSEELNQVTDREKFSDELEETLQKIWEDRNKFIPSENLYYKSESKKQQFIKFNKNEIVPKNWIGTIHFRGEENEFIVNLLPKLFYREGIRTDKNYLDKIFAHILWWLSLSDRQFSAANQLSLDSMESDLLEVMIYIFSAYTLDVFSYSTYNYYETVEEDLQTVKGRTDFTKYASSYGRGQRHIIPSVYDSFQYDNKFNQIVKYVVRLLKDFTKNKSTRRNLEDLLFILDEVDLKPAVAEDCDNVVLNPIYTEFKTILDNCRLFLSSMSVFKWKDEYDVFALLIPSEKLFENFIYGILKRNIQSPVKKVSRRRPGRTHLANQIPGAERFKMISDMVLKLEDSSHIIFDTKYKKIRNLNSDKPGTTAQYNISSTDMYQMVSYAVASGLQNTALIYPLLPDDDPSEVLPYYEITDEFSTGGVIRIFAFKMKIHSDEELDFLKNINEMFSETENELKQLLHDAVIKIKSF